MEQDISEKSTSSHRTYCLGSSRRMLKTRMEDAVPALPASADIADRILPQSSNDSRWKPLRKPKTSGPPNIMTPCKKNTYTPFAPKENVALGVAFDYLVTATS